MKIQVSLPSKGQRMRYKSYLKMTLGVALFALTSSGVASAQKSFRGKVSQAGQFVNDGQTYQVMQASQVPTAANPGAIGAAITGENPVQQVGCQSCGTGCGGSCGSYNAYGGDFSGYESFGGACSNQCGIPCDPYCYVRVEGLFMQREKESQSLSRDYRLGDFDYEWASRVTVGSLPNCVNGYEVTFVSPLEWNNSRSFQGFDLGTNFSTQNSTASALEAVIPGLGSFEDMTFQTQTLTSEFWSIEANRTLVGWDVAKILIGGRYIELDEVYTLTGTSNLPGTPLGVSTTENRLAGAQIGLDLLYPIGVFAYTDFRARAGLYYNASEATVFAGSNGITSLARSDSSDDFAGVFEIGSGVRYQLGEMLSVRAGSELWYISNIAAAADQFASGVLSGRNVDASDDIFVFGFNWGAELKF